MSSPDLTFQPEAAEVRQAAAPTKGRPAVMMGRKTVKAPLGVRISAGLGNFITDALAIVAPVTAWRMEQARSAYYANRGYEAFNKSRLTEHRLFTSRDADSELNGKIGRIRSFAREEVRNNGLARNMVYSRANNVVGDSDTGQGITIDPAVKLPNGQADVETNKLLKALWHAYKDRLEISGRWGEQDSYRMCDNELTVAGEVLVLLHDAPAANSDLPFSFELLEPDRLPTSLETFGSAVGANEMPLQSANGPVSGDPSALQYTGAVFGPMQPFGEFPVVEENGKTAVHYIKHGIEYDEKHRIVAFHILKDHPGDQYAIGTHFETARVPARNVIHYFQADRAEQTRGVSGLTAALPLLADIRDLITWELVAVKMGACFGIHVKGGSLNPLVNQQNSTAGGPLKDAYGNVVTQLEPGMMTMGEGEVQMTQGSRPGGTFLPFYQALVRLASAATNIGYSILARDYTGGSFSSLRQEALEDRRSFRTVQGIHVRHLCTPIWKRFVQACAMSGKLGNERQMEFLKNPDRLTACYVNTPGWDYVNPLQEATAEAVLVTNGFKTLDEVTNNSNMEPGERIESLAAYKAAAEKAGLTMPWAYGVAKVGTDGGKNPKSETTKQSQLSAKAGEDGGPTKEQLAEVGVQANEDFGGADDEPE